MGGLLAPANQWETFEAKWKRVLVDFKIPYFHMREFAHSIGVFEEWKGKEILRRKLFGKLMRVMEGAHPIPIGAVVAKETYDAVHDEFPEFKKEEPYYSALKYCVSGLAGVRLG